MTDETLNITLNNLRDDLDMLLNAHYSTSEEGIAGMKERIASAIANIDTLTTGLSETNTKLTKDEADIDTCLKQSIICSQIITPQVNENMTKVNGLWTDFRAFLEEFLTSQEKQNTVELSEKINIWSPYLSKLRNILNILDEQDAQSLKDLLENENTGGGTVSEELETQVNQNTANITTLQGRVTTLEGQVAKYLTPPDPNYTGKTFTDYPAGTIIQTYDYDERKLNMTSTGSAILPKIYFTCEPASSGSIKVTLKFKFVNNCANTIIKININNILKSEENFSVSSTEEIYTYEKIIYTDFNTLERNNNVSAFIYSDSSVTDKQLVVLNQKIEINTSNVSILNKHYSYDAISTADGKYHVADCSQGIAKIAEINSSNMYNMDNLSFSDTETQTEEYKFLCVYKNYSQNFLFDKMGYIYYSPNNFYYYDLDNSYQKYLSANTWNLDWVEKIDTRANLIKCELEKTRIQYEFHNGTNSTSTSTSSKKMSCVKTVGIRYLHGKYILNNNLPYMFVTIDLNGKLTLFKTVDATIDTIDLGYGSDATLYLTRYVSNTDYTLELYVKYFDKIIKKVIECSGINAYNISSSTELGKYEKYFKMPNNDYFVIANGKLEYYKEQ